MALLGKKNIDPKQIGVIVILAAVILLFVNNNFSAPLVEKNKAFSSNFNEVKSRAMNIENIYQDSAMITQIKEKIKSLESFLSVKLPVDDNMPDLNKILIAPVDNLKISISSINIGAASDKSAQVSGFDSPVSFRVLPVSMNMMSDISGLIKYLAWLKKQGRYISIERLGVSSESGKKGIINSSINLNAYMFRQGQSVLAGSLAGSDLGDARLEKRLSLPVIKDIEAEKLAIGEPFGRPEAALSAGGSGQELILSGIIIKSSPGKSTAIINKKFLKEGESINQNKIIKIEANKVTLEKDGIQVILKPTEK